MATPLRGHIFPIPAPDEPQKEAFVSFDECYRDTAERRDLSRPQEVADTRQTSGDGDRSLLDRIAEEGRIGAGTYVPEWQSLINVAAPAVCTALGAWLGSRHLLTVEAPLTVAMGMWAPDSKSVFLRTLGPDGQMEAIWRVPVDGGAAVRVDTGLKLDQDVRYVTVSPSGNQIAFTHGAATQGESEVWMLENFLPALKAN